MAENRALVPSTSAPITLPPDPKRPQSGSKVATAWLQFFQRLSKLANAALAAVSVAVNGALDGDGTPGSPLSVRVDGTTIDKVGNSLHVINPGITQLTGDVTAGPGSGSQVATIVANAVTYAKMQAVSAASRLLGRGTAGGTAVREISLGAGLMMTGDVLDTTGAGTVTSVTGTPPIASSGGATPAISLNDSAVTPGTYGDASNIPQVTVDAKGIVTDVVNIPVTTGGGTLFGLTRLLGDGATTVFVLLDFASYVLFVSDNGLVVDPALYTVAADGTTVTFAVAPTAAHVLTFNYVIATI